MIGCADEQSTRNIHGNCSPELLTDVRVRCGVNGSESVLEQELNDEEFAEMINAQWNAQGKIEVKINRNANT